ncbi:O-methyltransferase family 3 [Macrophomina phaseolina MS6]|uniref:catechol O-methyltransferase n=1 Tax=Macrophomina phaseolina (strain MS6) TaxID=1126212 RepID=K2RVW9_MACPH|nr:O-methyltransferase family 3 [Macrophomina phaseolina MS6]
MEIQLLNHIHENPSIDSLRGNPQAIADAIDKYAGNLDDARWLMTLGPDKSNFIKSVFARASPSPPKVFLEFGTYIGYSAIVLGAALRDLNLDQGIRYITFEKTPIMAAIASSLIELAGLKDVVEVHVGSAADSLRRLVAEGKLKKMDVDAVLLDHWKDFYISDLQACEELGLLRKGSIVLADNVKFPGVPEYLEYVKKGVAEKSADGFRYSTQTADFQFPFDGPEVNSHQKFVCF